MNIFCSSNTQKGYKCFSPEFDKFFVPKDVICHEHLMYSLHEVSEQGNSSLDEKEADCQFILLESESISYQGRIAMK